MAAIFVKACRHRLFQGIFPTLSGFLRAICQLDGVKTRDYDPLNRLFALNGGTRTPMSRIPKDLLARLDYFNREVENLFQRLFGTDISQGIIYETAQERQEHFLVTGRMNKKVDMDVLLDPTFLPSVVPALDGD